MRTALDALTAEHGVGVRLPRAASRSGLSIWLVSRRVDALTHSFKAANVHNNKHLFLHTLMCNQSAAFTSSSRSNASSLVASASCAEIGYALRLLFPDCKMLAGALHAFNFCYTHCLSPSTAVSTVL